MSKEIKLINKDILRELHQFNLEDKETMPSGKIAFSLDLESEYDGIDEIATGILEILSSVTPQTASLLLLSRPSQYVALILAQWYILYVQSSR